MKKLTSSTPAKIAAYILSYVFVAVFILSSASIVVMGYYKFYFSNEETVKQEILTDMAQKEAYYISQRMSEYKNLETYYKDKNVYYTVVDIIGGDRSQSNYNGEKYIAKAECPYYIYEYSKEYKNGLIYEDIHAANVTVYIPAQMKHNDLFSVASDLIHLGFKLQYLIIVIALLSLALTVTLICFLFCAAGHKSNGEIKLNYLDRLPIDIYTAFIALLGFLSFLIVDSFWFERIGAAVCVFAVGSIDYLFCLGFFLSIATRVKTDTLFKNSVIYRLLQLLGKLFLKPYNKLKFTISNLTLVKKTCLLVCGLIIVEFFGLIVAYEMYENLGIGSLLLPIIFVNLVLIAILLYFATVLKTIKLGGEKISAGNLEYEINTDYMFGDFKEFATSLNGINMGLQTAINEKIKSERFKTELITNVSHDIKTPLTSIINYVDLIKKQEIENDKLNEYIDVLDRQSVRLKKLVEDLVEASKASSGNLSVRNEKCNVSTLLTQALGEFEEKLKSSNIEPIFSLNTKENYILADGRHLWRVFDNLLNNVCKYALSGTRVYIDLEEHNGKTIITFRNISKYSLNISAEELLERFVRGDKSRNSEGSGLGLSIAKSLVELQNGELNLTVDGDLFKVAVIFDTLKEN